MVQLYNMNYDDEMATFTGWRGTIMGVAMATVNAMVTEFACQVSNIVVAVGPSVGPCCYTMERDQALDFMSIHPDCVPDPESARPHVDIRLANRYGSRNENNRLNRADKSTESL